MALRVLISVVSYGIKDEHYGNVDIKLMLQTEVEKDGFDRVV